MSLLILYVVFQGAQGSIPGFPFYLLQVSFQYLLCFLQWDKPRFFAVISDQADGINACSLHMIQNHVSLA